MGKIYCIIGKSGTGKDTVLAELLKNSKLSITKIVPYTTRPQREGEVEGVNYHYVSKFELNQMEAEGKVIEKRSYNTVHGEWIYFTFVAGKYFTNPCNSETDIISRSDISLKRKNGSG